MVSVGVGVSLFERPERLIVPRNGLVQPEAPNVAWPAKKDIGLPVRNWAMPLTASRLKSYLRLRSVPKLLAWADRQL